MLKNGATTPMIKNFIESNNEFNKTPGSSANIRSVSALQDSDSGVPAPIMWCFLAAAVAVFLMVFTGRLVGDTAGYCLLTVIVIGFILFRSGNAIEDEI